MKNSIKKRIYNIKNRLYVEAQYLAKYGFKIGTPIKYHFDKENKLVTITPVKQSRKHVAKTTQKTGKIVPVIDIKGEDVEEFFNAHNEIEIEIHNGKIIFSVLEEVKSVSLDNVINFEEAKEEKMVKKQYSRYFMVTMDVIDTDE